MRSAAIIAGILGLIVFLAWHRPVPAIEAFDQIVSESKTIPIQAPARPFDDATAAMERREYQTAIAIIQPLAKQGDARAQEFMGNRYFLGQGVQSNNDEALKWFQLSADQGKASAQTRLGLIYLYGERGVMPDEKKAVMWLQKAADQDLFRAKVELYKLNTKKGIPTKKPHF
jgi:uncharacterized protein